MVARRSTRRTASPAPAKAKQPLEREFQKTCVKWLDIIAKTHAIRYFAVPNGAHLARGAAGYSSLKAQGLKSGVPDLCILFGNDVRAPEYSKEEVLFVELKRPGTSTKLEGDQKDWNFWLNSQGFETYVVNDFDTFKTIVESYL
jgi:hypothetical protein